MDDSARGRRQRRRPWPPAARIAAAAVATAALALLSVACGSGSSAVSGGSPGASGSTSSPSAVVYSACVRSHGVLNFSDPDPGSGAMVPKADPQQLGVSAAQLQAAQTACQSLYPTNGGSLSVSLRHCEETGDCPQAMVWQVMTQLRAFAECMRSHGLPNWPDPTTDSQGRPAIVVHPWEDGFDPDTPQIANTMRGCLVVMQPPVPPPMVVYLPSNGDGG